MAASTHDGKMLWTSSAQLASVLEQMAEKRAREAQRIGRLIAELRTGKGWSQEDLAQRINVSVSAVSRWERGLHKGYGSNVRKLAKALGTSPAALRPSEPDAEAQLDRIERMMKQLNDRVERLDETLRLATAEQTANEAATLERTAPSPAPTRHPQTVPRQ